MPTFKEPVYHHETEFVLEEIKNDIRPSGPGGNDMNPIAEQLNQTINNANPYIFDMLSVIGKNLFFPKGILSQSAEAKTKAHNINATIGIAKEEGRIMHFPSVMSAIEGIAPEQSLTYAPSFGIPELRKAWQASLFEKNTSLAGKSISLPVVACGITHSISVWADVWVDPGDVVILPDMLWGNYNMILDVRKHAEIVLYPVFAEGGYNVSAFEAVVKAQAQKRDKIIVLLNFPHNPTGYSLTTAEAEKIVAILTEVAAGGTNVVVATDDAYFGLFFEDDTMKESIFARLCGQHERLLAVKLDGATKEGFVWGLRVGFVTYGVKADGDLESVYDALAKKTAGCVRGSISNASHLSQTIVLQSMQNPDFESEKQKNFDTLYARAKRVKEVLADPKYKDAWEPYPFNAGYFMCIRLKTVEAEPLRIHLLEKYGVGLIALGGGNLRVAFSCLDVDDTEKLFDTILQGVKDLS
jgi:aspartate/methionine/tyrosine aminotransferase